MVFYILALSSKRKKHAIANFSSPSLAGLDVDATMRAGPDGALWGGG